jgi:hypothetical protein
MEITLSPKQLELLQNAANEQLALRNNFNLEFSKVQKRIDDVTTIILEVNGCVPVDGIELQGNKLIIPDQKKS